MVDLVELAYMGWQASEEITRQENIILARDYFSGNQYVKLTQRLKEFLGFKEGGRFCINYCRPVVQAVAERLRVAGFAGGDKKLADWAWQVWQDNRMDALQMIVHQNALRDGEAFVFVDWDAERGQVLLLPHERYTDPLYGGTGSGCKAFFEGGDPTLPMEYATKRWVETVKLDNGRQETRQRMTVYYPDRIKKYVRATKGNLVGWAEYREEGQEWPLPWLDRAGRPLGIPVIPFLNPDRNSELGDAIPPQDAINKTAVDLLAAADATALPIRLTYGFYLTTDGKEPEDDGGNYVEIAPGAFLFVPEGKKIEELEIPDLTPLLESLDNWVVRLGQVTDTPLSRFQLTRQVKSEETLKQEEAPLLAKVAARQTVFGNAWEDALRIGAKIANVGRNAGLNEDALLSTQWKPAAPRDELKFLEQLKIKAEVLGVPREWLWQEAGYDESAIERMNAMLAEQRASEDDLGARLLSAFERGA